MTRRDDASIPASPAARARLLALLDAGDVDAALQAGLMEYAAGDGAEDDVLRSAQEQLRIAWAARERHRARAGRLERQAGERAARRAAASAGTTGTPAAGSGRATANTPAAGLPPAAAAALARARARANGQAG